MNKMITIRLNDVDQQLVTALKERFGLESTTELIRLCLRILSGFESDGTWIGIPKQEQKQ